MSFEGSIVSHRVPSCPIVCRQMTQDAGRRTQDAGRRTQDAEGRTQDAEGRTRDAKGMRLFSPARVATHHPHHDSADLQLVDDDRLHLLIGGLEAKLLLPPLS